MRLFSDPKFVSLMFSMFKKTTDCKCSGGHTHACSSFFTLSKCILTSLYFSLPSEVKKTATAAVEQRMSGESSQLSKGFKGFFYVFVVVFNVRYNIKHIKTSFHLFPPLLSHPLFLWSQFMLIACNKDLILDLLNIDLI